MRKDGPPKLGKSNKSKRINLEDLKDKAKSIKDKTKEKGDAPPRRETPPKLGKPDKSKRINLEDLKDKAISIDDTKEEGGDSSRRETPPKLGKPDKSKRINLDDLKDKAKSIKDKTKDKTRVKTKDKDDESFKKEYPPKLVKTDRENPLKIFFRKFKDITLNKNKRITLVLVLIVCIGAIGVFAVSNIPSSNQTKNTTNTTPVVAENHFDNGLVSFDYPKGWNVTNGTKAPLIVTVSKDENNSFSVMNENLKNTTFGERVLLWRQNILQSGSITYESNITMDNCSGYNIEATYDINNTIYNTRGIAIAKNNTVYFVIFIFNKSLLDYKNEMDQVMSSFHVVH